MRFAMHPEISLIGTTAENPALRYSGDPCTYLRKLTPYPFDFLRVVYEISNVKKYFGVKNRQTVWDMTLYETFTAIHPILLSIRKSGRTLGDLDYLPIYEAYLTALKKEDGNSEAATHRAALAFQTTERKVRNIARIMQTEIKLMPQRTPDPPKTPDPEKPQEPAEPQIPKAIIINGRKFKIE